MPPHLKRERIVHDLAEGEKYCTDCAQDLRPIGEESSERYEFIPPQVIVAKYADHLPLHWQAKMFRRWGVDLADQTLCGWMRQSAELLDPLYARLKQFVLGSKVVGPTTRR